MGRRTEIHAVIPDLASVFRKKFRQAPAVGTVHVIGKTTFFLPLPGVELLEFLYGNLRVLPKQGSGNGRAMSRKIRIAQAAEYHFMAAAAHNCLT